MPGRPALHPLVASRLMRRRPVVASLPHGDLTARERDVLRLVVEGLANKQIAQRLGIGEKTVKTHVSRVLAQAGCRRPERRRQSWPSGRVSSTDGSAEWRMRRCDIGRTRSTACARRIDAMGTLSGTTVMITGASTGPWPFAVAVAAAREGASLAICARGGQALEAVAEECRALDAEVLAVLADMSDATDVERFAATALERFGGIDVLVNNAAELGPLPLPQLTDAPSSALEHVLQANVLGPLRLTQAVIGGMLLRNRGLVVNISTDAAVIGFEGLGLYSASKAALDALTRSWSAELRRTEVRVISVDPGDMHTEMHMAADPEANPARSASP